MTSIARNPRRPIPADTEEGIPGGGSPFAPAGPHPMPLDAGRGGFPAGGPLSPVGGGAPAPDATGRGGFGAGGPVSGIVPPEINPMGRLPGGQIGHVPLPGIGSFFQRGAAPGGGVDFLGGSPGGGMAGFGGAPMGGFGQTANPISPRMKLAQLLMRGRRGFGR